MNTSSNTITVRLYCLLLIAYAIPNSLHAQSPERQFGVGVLLGNTAFASTAVTGVYAFSPNLHAGLAVGVQSPEAVNVPQQVFVGPFARVLLPIGATGLSPFFTATYFISHVSSVGLGIGMMYSIHQRVNIIGQLDPLRFGLRPDTASFQREQLTPFTSLSFPSGRIGLEFYF